MGKWKWRLLCCGQFFIILLQKQPALAFGSPSRLTARGAKLAARFPLGAPKLIKSGPLVGAKAEGGREQASKQAASRSSKEARPTPSACALIGQL